MAEGSLSSNPVPEGWIRRPAADACICLLRKRAQETFKIVESGQVAQLIVINESASRVF